MCAVPEQNNENTLKKHFKSLALKHKQQMLYCRGGAGCMVFVVTWLFSSLLQKHLSPSKNCSSFHRVIQWNCLRKNVWA